MLCYSSYLNEATISPQNSPWFPSIKTSKIGDKSHENWAQEWLKVEYKIGWKLLLISPSNLTFIFATLEATSSCHVTTPHHLHVTQLLVPLLITREWSPMASVCHLPLDPISMSTALVVRFPNGDQRGKRRQWWRCRWRWYLKSQGLRSPLWRWRPQAT